MDEWQGWRPVWRKLEFASVTAIAVTLGCIAIGQTAEQIATKEIAEPLLTANAKPTFNAIDYAQTGSTKIVIGPCESRKP